MISTQEVRGIFEQSQALLTGHFILSSGNHSNQYLQCARVTQYPEHAARLCEALAAPFAGQEIDVVLGPALGGIVIAQEMAQALHRLGRRKVRGLFCERENGELRLRRGFEIRAGERVLAVEDVVTTGGSVSEAVRLAKSLGAEVTGVAALVDRSSGKAELGAPFHSLLNVAAELYPPEQCPLCREGIPAVKPGSRGMR